jgi:hypothetical protein
MEKLEMITVDQHIEELEGFVGDLSRYASWLYRDRNIKLQLIAAGFDMEVCQTVQDNYNYDSSYEANYIVTIKSKIVEMYWEKKESIISLLSTKDNEYYASTIKTCFLNYLRDISKKVNPKARYLHNTKATFYVTVNRSPSCRRNVHPLD